MKPLKTLATLALTGAAVLAASNSLATRYSINPHSDVVGNVIVIKANPGDTIFSIAYAYDMGVNEMVLANKRKGYSKWKRFKGGESIVIPKRFILPNKRTGIVINLAELRIYYFPPGGYEVYTYPIASGKLAWRTPTGNAKVVRKKENPDWNVPESIKQASIEKYGKELPDIVPSGPDNPLGYRAMYLSINGYLIHGNNNHKSIGTYASSGCIRLYNEDIEELFDFIQPGTAVQIVYYPSIAGYHNGKLYMENNPLVVLDDDANQYNQSNPDIVVREAINKSGVYLRIHEGRYTKSIKQRIGVPVMVSRYPDE